MRGHSYSKGKAMPRQPAEVFGHALGETSGQAVEDRSRYRCPFRNHKCDKQSRLIPYPMGVCSVHYGDRIIAVCPRRFLQDSIVFQHIADHYFGTQSDLVVFQELSLSPVGTFDYVMVHHKPLSSDVVDFVMIEFQTGQTTGTGGLVKGLEDFLQGEEMAGKDYRFGLNLADIWKRSFTQILNKGVVLERWGHKIYWIVQEPVYQNLVDRYNLRDMTYHPNHSTIFMIYDIRQKAEGYELFQTRIESSTIDDLFSAFRHNPHIPPKDAFIQKLQRRLKAKMELKIQLG
ncbi:MAG: hypothetical protein D6736_05470 [Nitrospinota bacterium]|nr:MAG: hypothetical protein D6736_05470 [Nitrospinota bacterium]